MSHEEFVSAIKEKRARVRLWGPAFLDFCDYPCKFFKEDPWWITLGKVLGCFLFLSGILLCFFVPVALAFLCIFAGLLLFFQATLKTGQQWMVQWLLDDPNFYRTALDSGWIKISLK